ncbi:MAG: hypothetical protein CMJ46_07070 [Planctomyces sp.]|nr:hypothetical protein [Planctomyces sp.]
MPKKILAVVLAVSVVVVHFRAACSEEPAPTLEKASPPTSVEEARARALLLHETLHGTLQVIHRDFFIEDESRVIPSASLEDVFEAIEESHEVQLKWLIVETDIVNVDHEPQDEYERAAAKALAAGEKYYEQLEADEYAYTGAIRLASQCLKCHVQNRKDTNPRTAGLVIRMPVRRLADVRSDEKPESP